MNLKNKTDKQLRIMSDIEIYVTTLEDKIKALKDRVKLLEKTNKEIKQVLTDFLAGMIDDIDNW